MKNGFPKVKEMALNCGRRIRKEGLYGLVEYRMR